MNTPITDRAKMNWMTVHPAMNAYQDVVPVKTARDLEMMCSELATCLSRASFIQAGMHAKADAALAKYKALKGMK